MSGKELPNIFVDEAFILGTGALLLIMLKSGFMIYDFLSSIKQRRIKREKEDAART